MKAQKRPAWMAPAPGKHRLRTPGPARKKFDPNQSPKDYKYYRSLLNQGRHRKRVQAGPHEAAPKGANVKEGKVIIR